MRTFEQRPKTTQPTISVKPPILCRSHIRENGNPHSILGLQRPIGNEAVAPSSRLGHDLSRVPVSSGRTTLEGEAEEEFGPVSQTLVAGITGDAGGSLSGGVSTPAPAPPVSPPSPAPPCTITTKTLASAPDGTPDTRKTVGVNERVEITSSASATWSASGGTVTSASGTTVVWTAPGAGATCSVTATPAKGSPCSVSMSVIPPSSRSLVKQTDRAYTAGKAGSGFQAKVTIMPLKASFGRTELREETVNAVATGYYDTVLGWSGLSHPATAWLSPDASNSGLVDSIGTGSPGSPGPFSAGGFLWAIPQSYRTAGTTGGGSVYSTAQHRQVMGGTNGAETTSKEGASRSRVP